MRTIQIKDSLSTGLESSLDIPIRQISLKDGYLGFGGFGEVFEVVGLNGRKSKLPLVAKVLYTGKERNYQNVITLQKLVHDEAIALKKEKQKFFDKYPSLIALPLLSFEGDLDGKTIKGYLSLDLNKLGFLNAEAFFKINTDQWVQLQNRPWLFKYKIALVLSKGCSFLRKIHFIHADITPDNLFIHPKAPLCALIDFDSGAIITSANDAPTTEGKHYSEWEAPELTCTDSKINKLTAFADDWAIAITLHKILTGWQAFFTNYCSYEAMKKWSKMYEENPEIIWPKINPGKAYSPLFNKDALLYHDKYLECYEPIAPAIKKGFQLTFVKGATDYLKRWDSNKWVVALEQSIETCKSDTAKMTIDYFEKMEQSVKMQFPDERVNKKVFPLSNQQKSEKSRKNPHSPKTNNPEKTLKFIDNYIDELLPDLINGKESFDMHKGYISKFAEEHGCNGKEYIRDFQDFLQLVRRIIKDNVITNFEYTGLILHAKMLYLKKETIIKLLEPVKRK